MNQRTIIVAVALIIGLVAVYLANVWFTGVEQQQETFVEEQGVVQVAVASQDLEFGSPFNQDNVRLVSWPASSVPEGAFNELAPLLAGQVAIRPIATGEPILQSRISGRASLSANLPLDMRAVAIPLNDVTGVAGFVLPGDVVDVMLTTEGVTTVLLENVQVLAIDRVTNDQTSEPTVGGTATIQVDPLAAQKITLARQTGELSLALRNVENQMIGATPRVRLSDIGVFRTASQAAPAPAPAAPAPQQAAPAPRAAPPPAQASGQITTVMRTSRNSRVGPEMTIVRGTEATTYEVPRNVSR